MDVRRDASDVVLNGPGLIVDGNAGAPDIRGGIVEPEADVGTARQRQRTIPTSTARTWKGGERMTPRGVVDK